MTKICESFLHLSHAQGAHEPRWTPMFTKVHPASITQRSTLHPPERKKLGQQSWDSAKQSCKLIGICIGMDMDM